jgi:hypothetical protein
VTSNFTPDNYSLGQPIRLLSSPDLGRLGPALDLRLASGRFLARSAMRWSDQRQARQSPLGVNLDGLAMSALRLFYPCEPTFIAKFGMSQMCQKRTKRAVGMELQALIVIVL